MTLAETGTRGLLGATLGSVTDREETALAQQLLPLLSLGVLLRPDRAFGAKWFFAVRLDPGEKTTQAAQGVAALLPRSQHARRRDTVSMSHRSGAPCL